ncbi:nucleotidyltransferase family protein, partial [Staphylococcus aureus]|nr:nucleotidyltransferase family protein [Staphylococcus aureus]MVI54806.1 nucleotidyltransferase [Staphylococcus aureus]
MKSVGLITEYNPFHNGHQYHINQSKKLTNADVTIAIMSGNFVMRGEPAIYNKFTRAKMALSTADLVIELPATASLSSGDHFAELAVKVADYMSVDTIAFGSENNDIKTLKQLA